MNFVLSFRGRRDKGKRISERRRVPDGTLFTPVPGGGNAGFSWSGAMRCPKCYSTMQQVDYEGIEVDRCSSCGGIWFDAGELDVLRNSKAAVAIDTGCAEQGKAFNMIDHYRCPRCSGAMERRVDSRQRHIWYETCAECAGSFFDAGEFRDLAQLTISDLFKRWMTPERR